MQTTEIFPHGLGRTVTKSDEFIDQDTTDETILHLPTRIDSTEQEDTTPISTEFDPPQIIQVELNHQHNQITTDNIADQDDTSINPSQTTN
jgi:hypothetical protein